PGGQQRRPAGEPTGEQVGRDVGRPRCGLEHRPPVVARELGVGHHRPLTAAETAPPPPAAGGAGGRAPAASEVLHAVAADLVTRLGVAARQRAHGRRPTNAAAAPARAVSAARAAFFHMSGRSRVVTTGSGGSPYTSGSSISRNIAPPPPMPSPGSSRYRRASASPAPGSWQIGRA